MKELSKDPTAHPYPRPIKGRYRRFKTCIGAALSGLYFLLPWMRWDRGDGLSDQLILFDVGQRQVFLFDLYLWPQQLFLLALLLLFAALGLFLVSALWGRLWCGFACPQTIATDFFMALERFFESKVLYHRSLRQTPLDWLRLLLKHIGWLLVSFWISWTWLAYFNDATQLWGLLLRGQGGIWHYAFLFGVTGLFYLSAGFMRERVCIYICPYSRFQSVMGDEHTRLIAYQAHRGEPRGKLNDKTAGDCIDCFLCYHVCPTGVDIRNGPDIGCISCGLCIDACDSVMAKIRREPKLIDFSSPFEDSTRTATKDLPKGALRFFRLRTMIYMALMGLILGTMVVSWLSFARVDIQVDHVRVPLVSRLSDGRLRNSYTVHMVNKTLFPYTYRIHLKEGSPYRLSAEHSPLLKTGDGVIVTVEARSDLSFRLHVFSRDVSEPKGTESLPLFFEAETADLSRTVPLLFYSE